MSERTSADELLRVFKTATCIQRTDERLRQMLTSGQIQASYYSPAGQELIAASTGALLQQQDYLCTTYRGLHDQIAKGVPLNVLLAEYFGRASGACKGKGGPMHITHKGSNLLLTTGIVGSGLPIGTGLGWACALRGAGQVVVVNFGDGASNIGAFHESLNLAAVWQLPVIFLCQNNRYAEHTPYAEGTSVGRVADRAAGYGIPGHTVDGNSAPDMLAVMRTAIDRAREGGGPTLVEAITFRLYGHNINDLNKYMEPGELDAARAADPVKRLRSWLQSDIGFTEADLASVEDAVQSELEEAVREGLASPPPANEELYTDVYAGAGAR